MKNTCCTQEQMVKIMREADPAVATMYRISQGVIYVWRKRYVQLGGVGPISRVKEFAPPAEQETSIPCRSSCLAAAICAREPRQ